MNNGVVVTGIGIVLPETDSVDELLRVQQLNHSNVASLSKYLKGTVVYEDKIKGLLPSRIWKKLDSFTRYALVATQRAIDDAELDMSEVDTERCGVFVGNSFGGWKFTETELRNLHCGGPRMVSPYQATSWFPAAPQGQITIAHKIKGYSKTYMADRASSLISIGVAASMIKKGALDIAIAGGTESTNTDFVKAALAPLASYGTEAPWTIPISPEEYGFLVSEGSVFLILERRNRAVARNARIYCEIMGFSTCCDPCSPDSYSDSSSALTRSMQSALGEVLPDVIFPDACGIPYLDAAESKAIQNVCAMAEVTAPKMKYGHTFGSEGALDVAFASLLLGKGALGSYMPIHTQVNNVIINGRSLGGGASSLFLVKGAMQ